MGELAGEQLTFVPAPVVSWDEIKETHREASVLSRETGFNRSYGRNPYPGYDTRQGPIRAFFRRATDSRLPAMERVLGLWNERQAVAIAFRDLEESEVVEIELDGSQVVVFWASGTQSALDGDRIDQGRDVGSTGAFQTTVAGRALTFTSEGDGRFVDEQTRSVWTISGEAVEGPLVGETLTPVVHGNHFWFAWAAFQPDIEVVRP